MTKTPLELAREIIAAGEKATPGPWKRRVSEVSAVIRLEAPALEGPNQVIGYSTPCTLKQIVEREWPEKNNVFRDAAFIALARSSPTLASDFLEAVELIKNMLARDSKYAPSGMPNDCGCSGLSQQADREYEIGSCPHQLARAFITRMGEA